MNGILLLIVYILISILQIIFLVKAIKKNNIKYWMIIFLIEAISLVAAAILTIIYNNLPGSGFMPGLTHFGLFLFSFGASIIYALFLFITIGIKIFKFRKQR